MERERGLFIITCLLITLLFDNQYHFEKILILIMFAPRVSAYANGKNQLISRQ